MLFYFFKIAIIEINCKYNKALLYVKTNGVWTHLRHVWVIEILLRFPIGCECFQCVVTVIDVWNHCDQSLFAFETDFHQI